MVSIMELKEMDLEAMDVLATLVQLSEHPQGPK
jgi:hypothetical protein